MSDRLTDAELNELVMAHLTETASPGQSARLESLLASDPQDMKRYIQYVRESAVLNTSFLSDGDPETRGLADAAKAGAVSLPEYRSEPSARESDRAHGSAASTRRRSSRPTLWWALATAAAVVIAVFATQNWKNGPHDDTPGANNETLAGGAKAAASDPDVVARIIRKVDCVWEDQKWNVESTSALKRGQMLRVSQGMMEIEFDCGARVALQGPARFTIAGPKNGLFHSGHLTAIVPERARGFSIKAPATNIVDLGTSFSMNVDEDGDTEVYVIEGEVLSQPLTRDGGSTGKETKLFERDAMLVRLDGEEPIPFKDSFQFFRDENTSATGVEEWDVAIARQLVLWLAADHDVERDSLGGVRRWGDRIYGGNTRSEMAWQFEQSCRPQWLPDELGGKPALRFDGTSSFLVTDSLATTDEQTVMFVVATRPWTVPAELRFASRQVLNYNGPPNLALQFSQKNRFSVWNFVPTDADMMKHDGEFESSPLPANEPLLVCYTYSLKGQYAELTINGKSQGRIPVTNPAAIDSPKYIGCHWSEVQHLDGDLAELLIFNEALADDAAKEVSDYLIEKYNLPVPPREDGE